MSSLIPVSAHQVAPYARAVVAYVEPVVSSPSDDDRGWARAQTRGDAEGGAQPRVETLLPPDRAVGSARGVHSTRYREPDTGWSSAAFFAQHLSQEAFPADGLRFDAATAAAKYPSLDFDTEILLPGDGGSVSGADRHRVDITV